MEKIAELIDRLDNVVHAMQLPMPAETHMKALRESLPEIKDELKAAYLEAGGENVWSD